MQCMLFASLHFLYFISQDDHVRYRTQILDLENRITTLQRELAESQSQIQKVSFQNRDSTDSLIQDSPMCVLSLCLTFIVLRNDNNKCCVAG